MAGQNEKAFLDAAFPPSFRILGCDLRPFSVGHHMLLAHLGNRLVTGSDRPGAFDLFQALFVCSRDYEQANHRVRTRSINRWIVKIRFRLWLRRILVRLLIVPLSAASIDALIGAFADFLKAHTLGPELAPATGGGERELGTPLLQFVTVSLSAYLNHRPDQAMNRIWGHAIHDVLAYWELEGRTQLVSEQEREAHEEHLQLLKELNTQLLEIEKGIQGHGNDS